MPNNVEEFESERGQPVPEELLELLAGDDELLNSYPHHKGNPGHRGGSSPAGGGSAGSNNTGLPPGQTPYPEKVTPITPVAKKTPAKTYKSTPKFIPQDIHSLDDFDKDLKGSLKSSGWAVVTGTRESQGKHDSPENVANNLRLENELKAKNIPYQVVHGFYKGEDQGKNYLIQSDEPTAQEIGNRYGQESVLTHNGLVYSKDGSLQPAKHEENKFGAAAKKQEFYSQLPSGKAFSMGIDFSAKITKEDREKHAAGRLQAATQPSHYPNAIKTANRLKNTFIGHRGRKGTVGGSIALSHYSHSPHDTIDPRFEGTGIRGAQWQRKVDYPRYWSPRSYWGTRGYQPESGLGSVKHQIKVPVKALYDLDTDPQNFVGKAHAQFSHNQNYGAQEKGVWLTRAETMAKESGYLGYYSPAQKIAALFHPVKSSGRVAWSNVVKNSVAGIFADQISIKLTSKLAADNPNAGSYTRLINSIRGNSLVNSFPEHKGIPGHQGGSLPKETTELKDIKSRYTGHLSVSPVGRVGSYDSAVRRHVSRARHHWVIEETLPEVKITHGTDASGRQWESRNHTEEREDLGTFKTKTAAINKLKEIADAQGLKLEGDPTGYPRVNLPTNVHDDMSKAQSANIHQTETPAFKAWFGDSKVVDANGKPLVVYHGGRIGKSEFTGTENKSNYIQGNIFFTNEPAIAAGYAENNRRWKMGYTRSGELQESDGLYRCYLSVKNPLVVDAKGEGWDSIPFNGGKMQIDDIAIKARASKHDGLVVKNVTDQYGQADQYIVFHPTQIKSATSNKGTFNPKDPNITNTTPLKDLFNAFPGHLGRKGQRGGSEARQEQHELDPRFTSARQKYQYLLAQAKANLPEYKHRMNLFAMHHHIKFKLADIKSEARTCDKIVADYNGNHRRVKDMLRGTFMCANRQQADNISQAFEREFRVNPRTKRNMWAPEAPAQENTNYRDSKYNIRVGRGFPVEAQVSTRAMLAAKHKAHPLMKQVEGLRRRAASELRELTPGERGQINQLQAQQQAIYSKADV